MLEQKGTQFMARIRCVLICCFLAGFAIPVCAMVQDAPERPAVRIDSSAQREVPVASKAVQEQLLNLIPAPLPAQAVPIDAATFYLPETLYQYMDGGADIYVLYEFQTLLHQEFRAKAVDVTVDVFDMGVPDNAFGMYASERSPSYEFIAIGAEGYRNQGILNFLQGSYYVKLAAFGEGADAVLDQFARALAAKIGGKAEFPALLRQLPQTSRKPHSEQYLLKDPLGLSFLGPAYVASYDTGRKESTLLVSVAANAAEAQERMKRLVEHFTKSGKCDAAPELGEGAIRASNSFEGDAVARTKGQYLVVYFGPAGGSDEVFKDALQHLQ
jgi:hypothetical protein